MNLINLKSDQITALAGPRRLGDAVTIKKGVVYFTKTFCISEKLKSGQFVHFLNEGAEWRFIVNSDPDGFKLVDDTKKNGALAIYNSALCHLMRKSTGILGSITFPVEVTKVQLQGKKVYLIMTNKPLRK